MKKINYTVPFFYLFFYSFLSDAQEVDVLSNSWKKQVKPLKKNAVELCFSENLQEFYHSFKPRQEMNSKVSGSVWYSATAFLKSDTLFGRSKKYHSQTVYKKDLLLWLDYGSKELEKISKKQYADELYKTLRYTPALMLNYFYTHQHKQLNKLDAEYAVYQTRIDDAQVELYIRKEDAFVAKIITLRADELYGDVQDVYHYDNYVQNGSIFYPSRIEIEKLNGKLVDELSISKATFVSKTPDLLAIPKHYTIEDDTLVRSSFTIQKYSDHIYFINLQHTDDRVMLVNFADFLLIAEAPLNSANGELIIEQAKKIAPNKPIKYFAFGHFHNHYIGGVRAFVHKGAEIICSKYNEDYLSYLVNAPRRLSPDSLQMQARPLKKKELNDSLMISDGAYSLWIYFMGEQSAHTQDYLIYYFPQEKLVFEDDLVWIEKEGAIKKANKRQAGLYHAIKQHSLKVDTIVQSWPVEGYGVKTHIPFADLEESMR